MKRLIDEIQQKLIPLYQAGEAQALTRLLIVKLLGFGELDYFTRPRVELTDQQRRLLQAALQRMAANEPVQYVLGEEEFCGLTFKVNRSTLIPRPETAELVQLVVREQPGAKSILDIGTGSGCIAVALAKSLPHAQVTGWDIDPGAVETARQNARLNGVQAHFEVHDILRTPLPPALAGSLEVVVSNPPYITQSERADMAANVLQWEPATALFVPDDDPLLFYRAIARDAHTLLRSGGALYFEVNRAYGRQVCSLLAREGYRNVALHRDIYDNDRMVKAEKE